MAYNVMVVDDDRQTANYVSEMLRLLGHSVLTMFNPRTAMKQLLEAVPDVIFLDVNMPGIDGMEVCRYLRRDPATAETPIVVCSAYSSSSYRDAALEAGANLYLLKPIGMADLEGALKTVLPSKPTEG
jgi:CheY-like chemotaxis protein